MAMDCVSPKAGLSVKWQPEQLLSLSDPNVSRRRAVKTGELLLMWRPVVVLNVDLNPAGKAVLCKPGLYLLIQWCASSAGALSESTSQNTSLWCHQKVESIIVRTFIAILYLCA